MARPLDEFDAEALPDPELNPLLNPLLSAHMGRWAEVYFTNPPEKRGQAVSDLLRELRNEPPTESAPVQQADGRKRNQEKETQIAEKPPQPLPVVLRASRICSACSANNSTEQRFCGMCGAPLQIPPPPNESNFHTTEQTSQANWSEAEPSDGDYSTDYATERSRSSGGYARHDAYEPEWQIAETDLPSFAMEPESLPYRYRLYVGVAVALLLAGLVYAKWNGIPGSSGDASESAASRVIPAAPAATAPASTPGLAATRSVLPTEGPAATHPAGPAASQNQPETDSVKEEALRTRTPSPRVAAATGSSSPVPPVSSEQSGGEELATAEKYLDGNSRGGNRDNREAAQWLWKAVGKGNVSATLVLSDLYLRGDGVPKNCDQARLLLDAAARKGKAAAAQRLRNLQAFGCQ